MNEGPIPEHATQPTTADQSGAPFNPLLRLHVETNGNIEERAEAVRTYAFATPTDEILDVIVAASPAGIVELGAGNGYWAALLAAKGSDVVAYDIAPAPSPENQFFRGSEPWFPVLSGDEDAVADHPERTLLLVWPTYNEVWPADALERFYEAGGARVVFVGEPPGGRTGDDRFHALLGNLDRCLPCAYGLVTGSCICGIDPLWQLADETEIPGWGTAIDCVQILERAESLAPLSGETPGKNSTAAPRSTNGPLGLSALRELGVLGQLWTIGVIGFCIARAVVAWPLLLRYGVNPWWFLAIDIGTAPIYGLGQAMGVKLIRDETRPMRAALPWIAALFVAFVSPYAYLLASAGELPTYVIAGVVLWIVVFGAFAIGRVFRDARRHVPA